MKISNLINFSNKKRATGNVILSTGNTISGEVFQSKHDRVSEIHASGGMSTSSSASLYQGTGSIRSSASFSFEINSEINTRHEFWVKTDGPDIQFVFFTHIPIADGHEVSILPVSYEVQGQSITLGFLIENRSADRCCFYAVQGKQANTLIDIPTTETIVALLEERFVADAFGSLENCVQANPEVKTELLKVYQEFQKASGTTYWAFSVVIIIATTLFGWFQSSGSHSNMDRLFSTIVGFAIGGAIVSVVGKFTRAEKNANTSMTNLEEGKQRVGLIPLRKALGELFS